LTIREHPSICSIKKANTWYCKKVVFAEFKISTTFAIPIRELSSAGSEHLPYKQRVGGSNPSAPTLKAIFLGDGFLALMGIFINYTKLNSPFNPSICGSLFGTAIT